MELKQGGPRGDRRHIAEVYLVHGIVGGGGGGYKRKEWWGKYDM